MNKKIFKPIVAALFLAIVCITTFVIQIPSALTGGYINMGDCFVLLSGVVLGPFYGFLAAGLGSALADIMFGYAVYVPGTFIIKGLMALIVALAFAKTKDKPSIFKFFLFGAISEIVMVSSYFLYECFILNYGIGAAVGIPGNIFQGFFGVISSTLLLQIISKNIKLKNLLNWRD